MTSYLPDRNMDTNWESRAEKGEVVGCSSRFRDVEKLERLRPGA